MPVVGKMTSTGFTDEEIKIEQDIMRKAKTYEGYWRCYCQVSDLW